VGYAKSVSRGEPVFVDESPEPISALDEVRRRMHDLRFPGRRIWRLQIECAVWPVAVVVAGEDAEDALEVSSIHDQQPARHSARTVRTKRSAVAFAFGARSGVLMIWMPSLAKTASKSRVNLLSRSRIRKRNDPARSWSVQTNWRACW
jgi:hypothetical protein